MFNIFGKKKLPNNNTRKDYEFEIEDDIEDDSFLNTLRINLSKLIIYAESADPLLQREVAEKLANEAVNPNRQKQIVEFGGLKLLLPLTNSGDIEVQRLSAHALANLSVDSNNQIIMAKEGAVEMLIHLLDCQVEHTQRQASKALANLAVNQENKTRISEAGGLKKLIGLSQPNVIISVRIEAIAALANLAVNDFNEVEIVRLDGLDPIIQGITSASNSIDKILRSFNESKKHSANVEELGAQCCRALRNLSVNASNKSRIIGMDNDVLYHLKKLSSSSNSRIATQAQRAIRNLEIDNSGIEKIKQNSDAK